MEGVVARGAVVRGGEVRRLRFVVVGVSQWEGVPRRRAGTTDEHAGTLNVTVAAVSRS